MADRSCRLFVVTVRELYVRRARTNGATLYGWVGIVVARLFISVYPVSRLHVVYKANLLRRG